MTELVLNLEDVFHVLFDNVGVCTYCRRVVTAIFLAILTPRIFLILVLLTGLGLMGGLLTRYISKGIISRLSPCGVFLLLFSRLTFSKTLNVNFTNTKGWLLLYFYLCIDSFFDSLFPGVQFSASSIQLCLDRRSQVFSKVSDHNFLV